MFVTFDRKINYEFYYITVERWMCETKQQYTGWDVRYYLGIPLKRLSEGKCFRLFLFPKGRSINTDKLGTE